MYSRILVTLEHSAADASILAHVGRLAKHCGASVVLLHVADGWAARHFDELELRESEEMRADRAYLARVRGELQQQGLEVEALLRMGDPAKEICRAAEELRVDLIAMATHGHRLISVLIHGTTITKVRHESPIPLFLV